MRLEGLRTGIDLIQCDRVGLVVAHHLEFRRARFCRKLPFGVSLWVLQIFIAFAGGGIDGRYKCELSHEPQICSYNALGSAHAHEAADHRVAPSGIFATASTAKTVCKCGAIVTSPSSVGTAAGNTIF